MTSEMIRMEKWEANGIMLSETRDSIRRLLKINDEVPQVDVDLFIKLCQAQGLNPFIGDAYLVAFYSKKNSRWETSNITGRYVFLKRAEADPSYRGHENGVLVLRDGKVVEEDGAFILKGDTLVGGYARVYRGDRDYPISKRVLLSEYRQDNPFWRNKTATMICNTPLRQALRDAFPSALAGLYTAEEISLDTDQAMVNVESSEAKPPALAPAQASGPRQSSRSNLDFKAIMDAVKNMGWDREDLADAIEQTANTAGLRRWAAEKGIVDTDEALSWLTAADMPPESASAEQPPAESDYGVMNEHLFDNDISHAQMTGLMGKMFNEPNFLKWMNAWDYNDVGAAIGFVNNHFEIG